MEGVTILNQFEVVTETVFSWNAFWIGVLIGVGAAFILASIISLKEGEWLAFWISLLIGSLTFPTILGPIGGVICPEDVKHETRYEVSINENVNMQEFMNTYEIVETRGLIYTVREK